MFTYVWSRLEIVYYYPYSALDIGILSYPPFGHISKKKGLTRKMLQISKKKTVSYRNIKK